MTKDTKISICVPTYNQPIFLRRLLNSIQLQNYKNIEVIVSDDTPNDSIEEVVSQFKQQILISYFHHQPALKSPANWNFALDKASGDLLMLIHQDDWLNEPNAISKYAEAFEKNNSVDFIFSRNTPIHENGNRQKLQKSNSILQNLNNKPDHLLILQVIGPPSNVMIRRSVQAKYDAHFIWLVDIDYYSTIINGNHKGFYLDEHLVNIGLHAQQTTVFCMENPEIVLKENIYYAIKRGNIFFKDMLIFDYYWRFLRNNDIKQSQQIKASGISPETIPVAITDMLEAQKSVPKKILKMGIISKVLMTFCYLRNKKKYN